MLGSAGSFNCRDNVEVLHLTEIMRTGAGFMFKSSSLFPVLLVCKTLVVAAFAVFFLISAYGLSLVIQLILSIDSKKHTTGDLR